MGGPEGENDGPFGYFSFSMGSPDEDFNVILGPGETDHGMDKLKEFEQVLQDNNQRIWNGFSELFSWPIFDFWEGIIWFSFLFYDVTIFSCICLIKKWWNIWQN